MLNKIDYLKREKDIKNVCDVIQGLKASHSGTSFAVSGKWGYGKTFFLELLTDKLSELPEAQDDIILYYDCWKYNYYDEPIIPIMSILSDGLSEISEKICVPRKNSSLIGAVELLKKRMGEYAGHIIESKIGIDLYQLYFDSKKAGEEKIEKDNLFDNKFHVRTALESVREKLAEVAEKRNIIFIVDELDRCLPEYSIKILETVHHFFTEIDNVIIIFAIDKEELEHTIMQIYGENTDVERYLKKIIDFYIPLDIGTLDDACIYKYKDFISRFYGSDWEMSWLKKNVCSILHELDIRVQDKIWRKAILIHNLISPEEKMDYACLFFELFLLSDQYRRSNDIRSSDYEIFVNSITSSDVKHEKIRRDYTTFYCLGNSLEDRFRWYWTNIIHSKHDGGYSGKFYMANSSAYEKAVKKMKEFYDYSLIIH